MASSKARALFVAWSLGAAVVLLEVLLRLGAALMPVTPPAPEANTEALRVLALGDSWVYGAEAPRGQGFIDVVAELLPELSEGRPVQMFNHGRNGSNTAHVALTAMDQSPQLQPELLIILVGQNNASNFYRVAEVEQRLGAQPARPPLSDQLRVLKLARILWANYRGSSDYRLEGQEQAQLPAIPAIATDEWGQPTPQLDDLLTSPAAQGYLQREVESSPPGTGSSQLDLAWLLLYQTSRRDFTAAKESEQKLLDAYSWQQQSSAVAAPTATTPAEVLSRYALLRLARERGDWRQVRHHGGALLDVAQRNAISDLGGAEAALLAGDWRRSRALLTAAHNRLPGFLDTIDLASRFTPQARDALVYEALEFEPTASGLAHERARFLHNTNDYEGASSARREWLKRHPQDLQVAANEATWLVNMDRGQEALSLLSAAAPEQPMQMPPESDDPDLWRYYIASSAESGNREAALTAIRAALEQAREDAALLGMASRILADHEACDLLPKVASRWFSMRGDSNGFARHLSPCISSREAAHQLKNLREDWGPLGDIEAWTALVRAGHRPFALLYRDLDLVIDAARQVGAQVLLLNYPNPSEDHVVLRDILSDYAASRPVHYLDLWSLFQQRFNQQQWQDHLGPNGHCNAAGYRIMGEEIVRFLAEQGVLAAGS